MKDYRIDINEYKRKIKRNAMIAKSLSARYASTAREDLRRTAVWNL